MSYLSLKTLALSIGIIGIMHCSSASIVQAQTINDLSEQARRAYNSQDYSEAEQIWRQVLEQSPSGPLAYHELGNALLRQNKLEEAEASYRQATTLDSNFAAAHNGLGHLLKDQEGREQEAEESFRRAIQIDSEFAWAHYGLGFVLSKQNQIDEAIQSLNRSISLYPDLAKAHFQLGRALTKQGSYEKAEQSFRNALSKNENDFYSYDGLGNVLLLQGQFEEAEENYRKAIELGPNFAGAYNGLGNALKEQARYEEAEAEYRQAIERDPNFASAHHGLGVVLRIQKKYAAAEASFRKAIEIKPDFAQPYDGLGDVFKEQGQYASAADEYRRAIERDPDLASAYNGLGISLAQQELFSDAEDAFRRAININSGFTWAYTGLGNLYMEQERYAAAIDQYEEALRITPAFGPAQEGKDEAERQLYSSEMVSYLEDQEWLRPLRDDSPVLTRLRRSVVRVIVTPQTGGRNYGAGFVVKREGDRLWILTNRHVLTGSQSDLLSESIEVEFFNRLPDNRENLRLPAEVLKVTEPNRQSNLDLALISVESAPTDVQKLELRSQIPQDGEYVNILGHPGTAPLPWTIGEGYISNSTAETLQLTASLASGSSGGPVLYNNQVIGIVSYIEEDLEGVDSSGEPFGLAYKMEYLQNVLASWGIFFE